MYYLKGLHKPLLLPKTLLYKHHRKPANYQHKIAVYFLELHTKQRKSGRSLGVVFLSL
ncbi:hypothetical protein OESDEN_23721 [Oesophagostomum dentatum]|uniref:Uncharacterized protein n=1 Tax=Oesophagostomum dentatum TaxID=61180 RepID=A0A0B1RVG5_OESDE|nr:hypothetical protein OESDEN_23721 [Oesophagostomum dentatum]